MYVYAAEQQMNCLRHMHTHVYTCRVDTHTHTYVLEQTTNDHKKLNFSAITNNEYLFWPLFVLFQLHNRQEQISGQTAVVAFNGKPYREGHNIILPF